MHDVYIGRQPIYQNDMKVFAYELLFRAADTQNAAVFADADLATSQVLVNSIVEIGLDQIVGDRPAFFNMTRNYLLSESPLPFSGGRIVLEVLEDIEIDQELLDAVKRLSDRGYRIALDDFIFQESLRSLVDVADIVKIDITQLTREELKKHVVELRKQSVKLLAERVETQEEYDFCKVLGFDLYQGYFFCKPRVIKGQRIASNKLAILRLLMNLNNAEVDFEELENEISQDVSLSYRLLRTINSAFFALPRKVESIHQAVAYIGLQRTRDLAILLTLSDFNDKPNEVLKTALIRAKFCEKMGGLVKIPNTELFFTVGLFSTLDALMDAPLETVLKGLPLSEDIVDALLYREGRPGEVLSRVMAYERGDWGNVSLDLLTPDQIRSAYLESLHWADELIGSLA